MPMLPGRPLKAVGLVLVVLACMSPAMAMSSGQPAPSFESLVERFDQMPVAIEANALSEAADARALQARALPNPTLAYEIENVRGTGPYTGFDNGDTTVSINQPLELFGQRRARIDSARAEARATSLRSEQMRWSAVGRLAWMYTEAEAASRRYELASEALSLTEQDARAVALLVKEGREAALRGIQAESEAEAARAVLQESGAIRDAAFARLAAIALLDYPVASINDSLLDRTPGAHVAHADASLAVRIAQAENEAAARLVTVEERRARPDISATLGTRRFRETGDEAFTAGVSLSIPLFDRNRGGIRAAHAEQRAAEARLMQQQQEAKAERMAAEAILLASQTRTRAADSGVASAEEAYRLARIGFDAGRISQLELRSTRASLIASRNAAVDARVSRALAEIELAGLEGRVPFGEKQ